MTAVYLFAEPTVPFTYLMPRRRARASEPYERDVPARQLLSFAQKDLLSDDEGQGAMNALAHLKRALDQILDRSLHLFGLYAQLPQRAYIPKKMRLLESIGALPVTLIRDLNDLRNRMEHEMKVPARREVERNVDLIRLLLLATDDLLFSRLPVEALVGWREPPTHGILKLNREEGELVLRDLVDPIPTVLQEGIEIAHVAPPRLGEREDSPIEDMVGKTVRRIPLSHEKRYEWQPILSTLVQIQLGIHMAEPLVEEKRIPAAHTGWWAVRLYSGYMLTSDAIHQLIDIGSDMLEEQLVSRGEIDLRIQDVGFDHDDQPYVVRDALTHVYEIIPEEDDPDNSGSDVR